MMVLLIFVVFLLGFFIGFLPVKILLRSKTSKLKKLEDLYKNKKDELQKNRKEILILTIDNKHFKEREQYLIKQLNLKNQQLEVCNKEILQLNNKCAENKVKIDTLTVEINRLSSELLHIKEKQAIEMQKINNLIEQKALLQSKCSQLTKDVTIETERSEEKIILLENAKKILAEQFENLANRIFEEKGEKISNQNKENLGEILKAFKSDIKDFKEKVSNVYVHEAKERASLQKEVNKLFELNQAMDKEARNLTQALKGDKKLQGDWGEVVLERVLESSGLRKGHEYKLQTGFKAYDEKDNIKIMRPDAIVHLPDGKDVIIDAKVSLVNYDAYVRADSEVLRKKSLKKHIDSIVQHVSLLSAKNYENLSQINSLDFILMFMPIEAAFVVAFQNDNSLFQKSFKKRVIIVTPTTLLATLSTIHNTWKYENLNKNASNITDRATRMLEKFRGFIEDIETLGKQLHKSQEIYEGTLNKLSRGRGNLISQALQLESMGVHMKKSFPKEVVKRSELELHYEDR